MLRSRASIHAEGDVRFRAIEYKWLVAVAFVAGMFRDIMDTTIVNDALVLLAATGAARQARMLLEQLRPHPRLIDRHRWLEFNAYRAETVALNNLNLPSDARQVAMLRISPVADFAAKLENSVGTRAHLRAVLGPS
jgi:hypothetical protein